MTDYPKALAAARECLDNEGHRATDALRDLLAALDAQVPVAWRMFDGEGGYDFRDELPSENSRAWSARYGRKWEPLFAAPPAALAVPAGYVPVSALIEAREEVESWAAYATPYFQDKHDLAGVLAKIDGQIAAATQATPAAAVPEGYALVPVEPTEAMLDAGHAAAWRRIPSCFDMTDAEIVYRAMLAAAQAQRKEIAAINAEPAAATQNPGEVT